MSERIVDDFYLLDIDRTILKSTTFVEAYVYPALLSLYTNSDHAQRIIEAVKIEERQNRGQAFDYLAVYAQYMEQHSGGQELAYQDLAETILQRARDDRGVIGQACIQDILVEDSLRLVQVLNAKSLWGYLTTGGSQTQQLKLTIVEAIVAQELHIRSRGMVIASEQKAHMIETVWYDEARELFRIPDELSDADTTVYARRVTMIDDKPKNLRHTHTSISTYLAHAAETMITDDEGWGPRRSLGEIAGFIEREGSTGSGT